MGLYKIISSTKYVVENANDVSIDYNKIDEFCKSFKKEDIRHWIHLSNINLDTFTKEEWIKFLIIQDSINFSFWGSPKWEYNSFIFGKKGGSIAMVLALFEATEKNKNLLNINSLKNLTLDEIKSIFPKDNNNQYIPMIEKRLANIIEVGYGLERIEKDYNKNIKLIIDEMKDEEEMFNFIIKYFPTYGTDKVMYKGEEIYFYKRAQLVISDINSIVYDNAKFTLDKLTLFADYKIPQFMRQEGLIKYSDRLQDIIDNEEEILKGDDLETEIRASIIQAAEYMKERLNEKGVLVNSAYLDNYMFVMIKANSKQDMKPHHRVRTINY